MRMDKAVKRLGTPQEPTEHSHPLQGCANDPGILPGKPQELPTGTYCMRAQQSRGESHMHALAGERIEVGRQDGHQGLALIPKP